MAAGESREADYGDVLLAIVERLHAKVKGCSESTCYLSLDPNTIRTGPGDHVFVVSPLGGNFREGAFIGGGLNFLATNAGAIVKIHCPSLIDEESRDVQALTHASLSIIRKSSAVIAALCNTGAGPVGGDAWVPTKDNIGLTSHIRPGDFSFHKDEKGVVRSIEMSFLFEFDWDVTKQ